MADPHFLTGEHGSDRACRIALTEADGFTAAGDPADYVLRVRRPDGNTFTWSVDSVDAGPPIQVVHVLDSGDIPDHEGMHGTWRYEVTDLQNGAHKAYGTFEVVHPLRR